MDERYLVFAVPFFVVSMIGEAVYARLKGKRLYRLHDTIASLGCGIGQTLFGFWINIAVAAIYFAIESRAGLVDLPKDSAAVWIASLVLVDFCHYWFHRSSHRVNFLWAGHAVHHQSEDYNLSTALRQSWLEPFLSLPFYLPLAILGVPVEVFLATHTLQTLYQYWIHTRAIDRLGPIDWVFNTPTNHRAHHAINPEYIDKNYAGIFILWDRFFGTHVEEKATPAYGLVKPLDSFNPWYANVSEWLRIAALSTAAKTTREKLFAFVAPPEWLPRSLGGPGVVPPVPADRKLFDTAPGAAVDRYVAIQFGATLLASGILLQLAPKISHELLIASVAFLSLGLGTLGALMHAWPGARRFERLRLAALPLLGLAAQGASGAVAGALVGAAFVWLLGADARAR